MRPERSLTSPAVAEVRMAPLYVEMAVCPMDVPDELSTGQKGIRNFSDSRCRFRGRSVDALVNTVIHSS
ncbi:hypothetical protein VT03_08245 [Planctomyces sp. SH-PL14]|nr:hypothetical protein VT03_08245 [Planctomyces sp. SH-PL14]